MNNKKYFRKICKLKFIHIISICMRHKTLDVWWHFFQFNFYLLPSPPTRYNYVYFLRPCQECDFYKFQTLDAKMKTAGTWSYAIKYGDVERKATATISCYITGDDTSRSTADLYKYRAEIENLSYQFRTKELWQLGH